MSKTGIFLIVAAVAVALYFVFKGGLSTGGPLVASGTTAATPGVATTPVGSLASAFAGIINSFESPQTSTVSNPAGNSSGVTAGLIQGANAAGSSYENPTVAVSDLQAGVTASTTPGFIQGASGEASAANPTYGSTASSADPLSGAPVIDTTLTDDSNLLSIGAPDTSTLTDNTNDTYDYELIS